MSNSTGIRNLSALCKSGGTRDAARLAQDHAGSAQTLGREIGELVREHKEYLHLVETMRSMITLSVAPLNADKGFGNFRGSLEQQEARKRNAVDGLNASFTEMEKKLNEMHGRLSTIFIGINNLRG